MGPIGPHGSSRVKVILHVQNLQRNTVIHFNIGNKKNRKIHRNSAGTGKRHVFLKDFVQAIHWLMEYLRFVTNQENTIIL